MADPGTITAPANTHTTPMAPRPPYDERGAIDVTNTQPKEQEPVSFDAIFDQPEIITNLDDLTLDVVTYPATATRTGETWTATAHDLPNGQTVQAEGSSWLDAEYKIHERVTEQLGVDPTTIVVSVKPANPEANAALYALTGARIARAKAEQAERDAARHAARLLVNQGWTPQDAGEALRYPAARIEQITATPTAQPTR